MIIKQRKYKKIKKFVDVLVQDEVYGCDECRKEIKRIDFNESVNYLDLTIFRNKDNSTDRKQFCSWRCVLKYLPKIKCDYFVSMPMLYYDNANEKVSAKELMKLLK